MGVADADGTAVGVGVDVWAGSEEEVETVAVGVWPDIGLRDRVGIDVETAVGLLLPPLRWVEMGVAVGVWRVGRVISESVAEDLPVFVSGGDDGNGDGVSVAASGMLPEATPSVVDGVGGGVEDGAVVAEATTANALPLLVATGFSVGTNSFSARPIRSREAMAGSVTTLLPA